MKYEVTKGSHTVRSAIVIITIIIMLLTPGMFLCSALWISYNKILSKPRNFWKHISVFSYFVF